MSQAALDRQVRPIYDALDAGSNKSAIQQCSKVLKKYPKSDLVKALKALACFRMNRIEECLPLCDEVLANKPIDIEVLTAMMHVLRALGRHTDLVVMYDEAFRAHPNSEELGMQDFFANVRTGNWKAAQQVAQRLHKSFGSPSGPLSGGSGDRYLYWAVLGALLQADDTSTSEAMRGVLHKLAGRLLEQSEVPPYATAERMHVHLTVMQSLEENDKAAALLESEEGKAVVKMSLVVDEMRREIVRRRGDWVKEGERARQRITEENDRNWLEFMAVVDAAAHVPEDALHEAIDDARAFFRQLADKDGRRERAAPLALLELERVARTKGVGSEFGSDDGLFGLIRFYFARFGEKPCCFEDLRTFICPISAEGKDEDGKGGVNEEERKQIAAFLDGLAREIDTEPALQRTINAYKLRRYLYTPSELSSASEQTRSLEYLHSYSAALPLGKALPATELQPADDLTVLAAQTFCRLWKEDGDEKWLYMAASILEYAVGRSKSSYVCRLHLVRIYRLLFAPSLALSHYRALLVKQIQNDTLSHFVLARASTFSLAASGDLTLTQECVEASQIYVSNSQETSEFIVRAFAQEKYSQVADLINFEERLDNSLQRDLVKIEHVRMRVAHEGALQELVDTELIELKFIFDRVHHDNRDFEVLPNYQPHGTPTFNDQSNMFNSPGYGWLTTFLRIYIRVFLLASDIDDTVEEKLLIGDRPKVADGPETRIPLRERIGQRKEAELAELTPDELSLFDFVSALCDWLAPYHDHARPSAEAVLAEAARQEQERLRVTGGGKGSSRSPSKEKDGSGSGAQTPTSDKNGSNGAKKEKEKVTEEPPLVKDAPEVVTKYFDAMAARFKEVSSSEKHLDWETLHIATLAQEAALMLALISMRFKAPAVVKANKFGALTTTLRSLRQGAASVLKEMGAALLKTGAAASTAEQRRAFVDACKPIQEVPEFDHDKVLDVAKSIGDARKRAIEGIAKGLTKIANTQMQ